MKPRGITQLGAVLTLMATVHMWGAALSAAGEGQLDTAAIERLTGVKGELSEGRGV